MIPQTSRNEIRKRVHTRIRERMMGSSERPRLNIYRSLNHIYAQVIDDAGGVTIASASTVVGKKGVKNTGGNVGSAKEVDKHIDQEAREQGVKKVVYDRGGYINHRRIQELADDD